MHANTGWVYRRSLWQNVPLPIAAELPAAEESVYRIPPAEYSFLLCKTAAVHRRYIYLSFDGRMDCRDQFGKR